MNDQTRQQNLPIYQEDNSDELLASLTLPGNFDHLRPIVNPVSITDLLPSVFWDVKTDFRQVLYEFWYSKLEGYENLDEIVETYGIYEVNYDGYDLYRLIEDNLPTDVISLDIMFAFNRSLLETDWDDVRESEPYFHPTEGFAPLIKNHLMLACNRWYTEYLEQLKTDFLTVFLPYKQSQQV